MIQSWWLARNILERKNKALSDSVGMFLWDVGEKMQATEPRSEKAGKKMKMCGP